MGIEFRLPDIYSNPSATLPVAPFRTPLQDIPNLLGCWDFRNRADQSGNGHDLIGTLNLDPTGLVLATGASGIRTGLTPATPNITLGISAQVNADASGYLVTNADDPSDSGCGISYVPGTDSLSILQFSAAGSGISGTSAKSLNLWFTLVFTITATQIRYVINSSPGVVLTSTSTWSALNNPVKEFLIGDGHGTTKGVASKIGALYIASGITADADLFDRRDVLNDTMLEVHGVTV